jgi:hypothetical protein
MPDADRAEYLRRVIMARAPEIGPADLVLMTAEPDDALPSGIAEAVTDALAEMEERLAALEEGLRLVGNHDNDDHDRRRARQAGEGDLIGGR